MSRCFAVIFYAFILFACTSQPAVAPVPTDMVALPTSTLEAIATRIVPTEISPTPKPPSKPVEIVPVLVTNSNGVIDVAALFVKHPEINAQQIQLLQSRLNEVRNNAPENQKYLSMVVVTNANETKSLWFQAGSQPLVAQDINGQVMSPVNAFAHISEIAAIVPLGPPTYTRVDGAPADTLVVPRFIKSYASVIVNDENRILANGNDGQPVANLNLSSGKAVWIDKTTGKALPSLFGQDGGNIGWWENPTIPLVANGTFDFSNPDKWYTPPTERLTATNAADWEAYYLDYVFSKMQPMKSNNSGLWKWGSRPHQEHMLYFGGMEDPKNDQINFFGAMNLPSLTNSKTGKASLPMSVFGLAQLKRDKTTQRIHVLINKEDVNVSRLKDINYSVTFQLEAFDPESLRSEGDLKLVGSNKWSWDAMLAAYRSGLYSAEENEQAWDAMAKCANEGQPFWPENMPKRVFGLMTIYK